jgi:hypothetical protein
MARREAFARAHLVEVERTADVVRDSSPAHCGSTADRLAIIPRAKEDDDALREGKDV